MEDAKIKKIIRISTLAIILGIIGLIVGKEMISKAKIKKSAQTSEIIQAEDIYHLDDVILTILNDETPFSMGMVCEGIYTYVSGAEVKYLLSARTDNTVKEDDPSWVKMENTSTATLSIKTEESGAGTQEDKTTSYLKISEDKNTQYTDDGTGQWFYTDSPIEAQDTLVPTKESLRPFINYLYKNMKITEKDQRKIISVTFFTRDEELVEILNEMNSELFIQTMFAGLLEYETTVTMNFTFKDGNFTSYQVETSEKEYAFDFFKNWSGFSDENAIISAASVRIILKVPETAKFDIPKEVLNAISEEEWVSRKEPIEEIPSEEIPSETPSEEENNKEDPEIPSDNPYKVDITDKSSVFDYLKEKITGGSASGEYPKSQPEDSLEIEEIRKQYGEELDKMLDDYEKEQNH